MGSILGPVLIVVLLVIAIPLALLVSGALLAGGIGLLGRGVSRRPAAKRVRPSGSAAAGARPAPAWRRVLLVLGGLAVLALSMSCLVPVVLFGAKYGPRMLADLRDIVAEEREKPTLEPALEDVRRFVAAERAYQARNGGFFGTPECLVRPQVCIPGYAGPPFIDAAAASLGRRGGFVWTFHPGPPPDPSAGVSPSSASGYALLGVRAEPFDRASSVCGDAHRPNEGIEVCTFHGRELDAPGACPASCIWNSWSIEPLEGPR